MEELVAIMGEIRDQLIELNSKLDSLTDSGTVCLSDIVGAINEIKGDTGYDLTDIQNKLAELGSTIEGIKGDTGYDLTDIHTALNSIDSSLGTIDSSLSSIDSSVNMISL